MAVKRLPSPRSDCAHVSPTYVAYAAMSRAQAAAVDWDFERWTGEPTRVEAPVPVLPSNDVVSTPLAVCRPDDFQTCWDDEPTAAEPPLTMADLILQGLGDPLGPLD